MSEPKVINASSGKTRAYWVPASRSEEYPRLASNLFCDVLVVGGGIAGVSCAYSLAKAGKSVVLLDDGLIGSGETSRTSAHLTAYLDDPYFELSKRFGIENARLACQSHKAAIDLIENIINAEHIDCHFKRVPGYLFLSEGDEHLAQEAKILERMGNFPFRWEDRAPITSFNTGPCLEFPNQAQIDPMKYLKGLAHAIIKYKGQIFEGTHVSHIKDGSPCLVTTSEGFRVEAQDVIIATNSPINDRLEIQTKQAQYRTYIIAISLPKGEVSEALYWDTGDPYHYIRVVPSPDPNHDYILLGGEDHKTGQKKDPKKAFAALEAWAASRFSPHKTIYQWSGQIVEPVDRLAFIGRNPGDKHIYIHTGQSGNGLSYGAMAGMLLPDLIVGNKSPYQELYEASRKPLRASGEFIKENANTVAQYIDWLRPAPRSEDLLVHEGHVIRKGLSLHAVYKDENGDLHHLSAVCPHLGGIVRWNNLEKTWDCPCHGSRFGPTGEVINGPANRGLKQIKKKQ